jgi:glycosyltransferase involved in cell wall biosynthesis
MNPRWGGAERTIYEVCRRLVARGHVVQWVSSSWANAPTHAVVAGIEISRLPTFAGPHLAGALLLNGRSRPDVVVDDLAHALPWCSPLISRIPTVAFFRHLHRRTLPGQVRWPISALLTGVERYYPAIYRGSSFVTESSQSVSDLKQLGVGSSHCVRIPPGVDTNLFRPTAPARTPLFVYFGGLRHYKRPEDSIRALAMYRRSNPVGSLTIVGSGPCIPHLVELVRSEGLQDSVRFVGRLTEPALATLVGSAWANIHCSVAEGWCLSAMEAAACGVPTVAYDVPGIHESVVPGGSGILVDGSSPIGLADALAVVVRDPERWRRGAREHALRFDWNTCTEAWEELLRRVAQSGMETPGFSV